MVGVCFDISSTLRSNLLFCNKTNDGERPPDALYWLYRYTAWTVDHLHCLGDPVGYALCYHRIACAHGLGGGERIRLGAGTTSRCLCFVSSQELIGQGVNVKEVSLAVSLETCMYHQAIRKFLCCDEGHGPVYNIWTMRCTRHIPLAGDHAAEGAGGRSGNETHGSTSGRVCSL